MDEDGGSGWPREGIQLDHRLEQFGGYITF